jgi:hypothetical protein
LREADTSKTGAAVSQDYKWQRRQWRAKQAKHPTGRVIPVLLNPNRNETMTNRTDAERFLSEPNNFRDTNQVMIALDARELDKDQNWQAETTTWTFPDGSKIQICGNDVDIVDESEAPQ